MIAVVDSALRLLEAPQVDDQVAFGLSPAYCKLTSVDGSGDFVHVQPEGLGIVPVGKAGIVDIVSRPEGVFSIAERAGMELHLIDTGHQRQVDFTEQIPKPAVVGISEGSSHFAGYGIVSGQSRCRGGRNIAANAGRIVEGLYFRDADPAHGFLGLQMGGIGCLKVKVHVVGAKPCRQTVQKVPVEHGQDLQLLNGQTILSVTGQMIPGVDHGQIRQDAVAGIGFKPLRQSFAPGYRITSGVAVSAVVEQPGTVLPQQLPQLVVEQMPFISIYDLLGSGSGKVVDDGGHIVRGGRAQEAAAGHIALLGIRQLVIGNQIPVTAAQIKAGSGIGDVYLIRSRFNDGPFLIAGRSPGGHSPGS